MCGAGGETERIGSRLSGYGWGGAGIPARCPRANAVWKCRGERNLGSDPAGRSIFIIFFHHENAINA